MANTMQDRREQIELIAKLKKSANRKLREGKELDEVKEYIERRLDLLDIDLGDTWESVCVPDGAMCPAHSCEYLNVGDTYKLTLLYDEQDERFHVSSWGGWLESKEEEYGEEMGETRCFNCGQWTDRDGEECDHCGSEL